MDDFIKYLKDKIFKKSICFFYWFYDYSNNKYDSLYILSTEISRQFRLLELPIKVIQGAGLTHENLYSSKNNHYRKKSAALPAAALPSAAADRNRNRTAQSLFTKRLLAIPCSTALQKMSIFENAALVRESVHVYTQVCFVNLQLNGTRYFSVPFKLGQNGSAAVPLPCVPPFLM